MEKTTINRIISDMIDTERATDIKIVMPYHELTFPVKQMVDIVPYTTHLYIRTRLNDYFYIDLDKIEAVKVIVPNE